MISLETLKVFLNVDTGFLFNTINHKCTGIFQGSRWSWKVLEFTRCKFKALKVLENEDGP